MRRLWLLLAGLVLVVAACGERAPARFNNTDISGAEFGRSLAGLADAHGKAVTLADFKGQALIVFFGYTSCPDVCPTSLARFAAVKQALGKDASRLQVLLITLDPERDTPEKLGAYVSAFDPSFIGLTGDLPAIEATAREFKVFFARSKAAGADAHGHDHGDHGYTIDHSAGAYVFDPAGRIRLYVKDDAPVDALAADVKLLLAGK